MAMAAMMFAAANSARKESKVVKAVSYTHLTLPTSYAV